MRHLDEDLLRAWVAKPGVANMLRQILPTAPTHFNNMPHMKMRELLIKTDCGPSNDEVRALLTFLKELGIANFEHDLVWATKLAP